MLKTAALLLVFLQASSPARHTSTLDGETQKVWHANYLTPRDRGRLELVDKMKPDLFEGFPAVSIIRDRKTHCEWFVVGESNQGQATLIPDTCHVPH